VARFQTVQGDRSMIPGDQRYRTFYAAYNAARHAAGVSGHEYRHHWAQQRFQTASEGIAAPHAGGPAYAELTPQEKARWDRAAAVVNQELGHGEGRQDITSTYIGS
jgi:hypothetical protein